jgi:hypothetical protein
MSSTNSISSFFRNYHAVRAVTPPPKKVCKSPPRIAIKIRVARMQTGSISSRRISVPRMETHPHQDENIESGVAALAPALAPALANADYDDDEAIAMITSLKYPGARRVLIFSSK